MKIKKNENKQMKSKKMKNETKYYIILVYVYESMNEYN